MFSNFLYQSKKHLLLEIRFRSVNFRTAGYAVLHGVALCRVSSVNTVVNNGTASICECSGWRAIRKRTRTKDQLGKLSIRKLERKTSTSSIVLVRLEQSTKCLTFLVLGFELYTPATGR